MAISPNELKVALAQEAAKIVVALINNGGSIFCSVSADEAGRRAAQTFATVYAELEKKTA